ncbi:hypothetical protein AB7M49_008166 [Bradyrhizobium elkanii]
MSGAATTKPYKDGNAGPFSGREWDESGTGAGPFSAMPVLSDGAGGTLAKAEDAPAASGDPGLVILGVRRDTAASSSGTDGDYSTFNFDSSGKLWVHADATVTGGIGGDTANDAVDSGNPVKVGSKAIAGLSTATLVSAADRVENYAGLDGAQITRPHCGLEDIVSGNAADTSGNSTSCISAQGSGIKTYLTSVILCNTSATAITVDIKDGSTVKVSLPVPAGGGCIFNPPVPIPGSANTAWNFDGSAAATTVTCSMVGFKSKV